MGNLKHRTWGGEAFGEVLPTERGNVVGNVAEGHPRTEGGAKNEKGAN